MTFQEAQSTPHIFLQVNEKRSFFQARHPHCIIALKPHTSG